MKAKYEDQMNWARANKGHWVADRFIELAVLHTRHQDPVCRALLEATAREIDKLRCGNE